jgi:hypothetical protein
MEIKEVSHSESENQNSDLEKILKYKEEFYETTKKNMFFKNAQKRECAESICNKISLVDLMNNTFWIVPNKNQMYFDYRIFKLYGTPSNYGEIVDNVLRFCSWCVSEYGTFEIHVNLATFTVSAAERYRDIIIYFCDESLKRDTMFSEALVYMNIYNVPSCVDQISRLLLPLIPPDVRSKLRLFKKEQSVEPLMKIYEDSGKTYNP